jgi:hypothetical protein
MTQKAKEKQNAMQRNSKTSIELFFTKKKWKWKYLLIVT